jgi:hypothetical protein
MHVSTTPYLKDPPGSSIAAAGCLDRVDGRQAEFCDNFTFLPQAARVQDHHSHHADYARTPTAPTHPCS